MSQNKKIFVTGVTGNQGGSVARALLSKGHQVLGLTRNTSSDTAKHWTNLGVELIQGDFLNPDQWIDAIKGADGLFAMTTPFEEGMDKETEQGIKLTDVAKKAGIKHLIYTSVANANLNTGIPHFDSKYEVEKYLQQSGLNHTIVAPVFFMDNALAPWMLPGLQAGNLSLPLPGTTPLQQVSVEDIGAFVSLLFEHGESVYGKRFDIAGDELTGPNMASVLTFASGCNIQYQGFPTEVLRKQNEDMALMFEWFDKYGYTVNIDELKLKFPEMHWHRYDEWAMKQDWKVLQCRKAA